MEILIPTADRPDVIGLCLLSLSHQTYKPSKVAVFDNGSIPIFSSYIVRMVWDILAEKGINLVYLRKNKRTGLTRAREVLLQQVTDDFMPLDDDALLEPEYLRILHYKFTSNINFIGGLFLIPNNEIQKPDFSTQKLDKPPEGVSEYQYAFFRYKKGTNPIPISYGGISGVLFRKESKEVLLETLKDFPDNAPLEEFIQTKAVGNGLLVPDAVAWHLFSPEQRRDWRYDLENVFRKAFQDRPKQVEDFLKGK